MFGFSFAMPFLALYLHQDLGVYNEHQLGLWTGFASAASGFAMAIAGPIGASSRIAMAGARC